MVGNARAKKYFGQAVLFLALFLVLTVIVMKVDVQPVGPEGTSVGLATLNLRVRELLDNNGQWLTDSIDEGKTYFSDRLLSLSDKVGYISFLPGIILACIGAWQLFTRKSLKKVDADLLALGGLYIITVILYVLFTKIEINYRPAIIDLAEGLEPSYPSSHLLLAVVMPASCIHQYNARWGKTLPGKITVFLCAVIMALLVIGRLMSGVHWFTDVLAGVVLGHVLYCCYLGVEAVVKKN